MNIAKLWGKNPRRTKIDIYMVHDATSVVQCKETAKSMQVMDMDCILCRDTTIIIKTWYQCTVIGKLYDMY